MNDRPTPSIVIQDDKTIIVKGYCASGKTTLAQIIAVALADHGINSLIVGKSECEGDDPTAHYAERIKALKAKGTITIETVQLNRAFYNEQSSVSEAKYQ